MELSNLNHYNRTDLLKYLAYLQVCPDNSANLQTLQELQNMANEGNNIISDCTLWTGLDEAQTWLFVENYICFAANQFRAFVSDATERPWQMAAWIDFMVGNDLITRKELYPTFFFLCLSDKIAERLGLNYYEIGDYKNGNEISLLDINNKMKALTFSNEELMDAGHNIIKDLAFLKEYELTEKDKVEKKPFLKEEKDTFVLSPNALMNCAWREMLKAMKAKYTDIQIQNFYFASLTGVIHQTFASKWRHREELKVKGKNTHTAVYELFYNHYIAVTVINEKIEELDENVLESVDFDSIDVTNHLETVGKQIRKSDNIAKIAHVVVPFTIQDEMIVMSSNDGDPTITIKWKPLSVLLEKNDDNPLWLFHYIYDRKETTIRIKPDTPEEDVMALYIASKHSFYLTDRDVQKLDVTIRPGYGLSLFYDILQRGNKHAVSDPPFSFVVSKDQECPRGIPFYEINSREFDILIGEYYSANIFLRLPPDTRKDYPELHTIGRSVILWYYALEKRFGKALLQKNLKLTVKRDDSLTDGIKLKDEHGFVTLMVSQNFMGNDTNHVFEKKLLLAVLNAAHSNGILITAAYEEMVDKIFGECQGGLILRLSSNELIGDNSIGDRVDYVVDERRTHIIYGEISKEFNHYPVGPLSCEDSSKLAQQIIHSLNRRITDLLEQFDVEKLLVSLHTLRDGLIFWNRTLTERYNSMITFYRYLGTFDPVQENRINEFVESDLAARCLMEYTVMKCSTHGEKDIMKDLSTVDELFSLIIIVANIGALSDCYRSSSYQKPIESLPNGRLFYPIFSEDSIGRSAKDYAHDRLEHPEVYDKISSLLPDVSYDDYIDVFDKVFNLEFGLSYNNYETIRDAIIAEMQSVKKAVVCEEVSSFKERIAKEAKVSASIMNAYITAFSISEAYRDLSVIPFFGEYDTFPCRYKRRLGLIYRPFCIYNYQGKQKISFSYRGFIQSQMNLLENIRLCNYTGITSKMRKYVGTLNKARGDFFEEGVFDLYSRQDSLLCHRSALIHPKKILNTTKKPLGDIDVMLIDNTTKRILLIEAKYYNECKTAYEAYSRELMLYDDMKHVVERDEWAKKNKALFEYYAKKPTEKYSVASVILTYNQSPTAFFIEKSNTPIPVVWIRDVIENPMAIFDMVCFG